jgi:hypothetical protein
VPRRLGKRPERLNGVLVITEGAFVPESVIGYTLFDLHAKSTIRIVDCFAHQPVPGELLIRGSTPSDSMLCYDEEMRDLVILFVHVIANLVRLLGPGDLRSVVAESVHVRQQLLILNRSRQRLSLDYTIARFGQ